MSSVRISEEGLALIRQFEGFRDRIYLDAAGLPTIGYGHLLHASEMDIFKNGIDADSALALLREDVQIAEHAVHRFIVTPLQQHQFDALVSFTFNLGAAILQRSTLRRVVNRGEHEAVPEQLMRFIWAGGKKVKGLIRRRTKESMLYVKWL